MGPNGAIIDNSGLMSLLKKDADFAIIVLNKVDVDSINPNLSTIQIVNNCAETKSMLLLGFPKANNHKEVLSSNVTRIEERI